MFVCLTCIIAAAPFDESLCCYYYVIYLYVVNIVLYVLNCCSLFFLSVDEWRGKWFLEKKWDSMSREELLKGMSDINDHVRLSAVSACSKAILNEKIREIY